MYAPLKPSMYTFQMMPWIEVSEKALMKLAVWMEKNNVNSFSDAILTLLGENPENRIEIIHPTRTLKVDYDQVVKLEADRDGGDD